ncbi:UNVERIFIED_CONTAM: hypothetical protein Sangu_2764900 [Sesamum angustifolium]|uniref:Integrase catalytic domain-containing protein n=1 Tax=Sesamum angustifolium TaxID=2727405 RepID=A0AAW2ITG6_9LAMI
MESIKVACPFDQWGIDILGPFPPAPAQKKFIILAVEYFSKWVEVEALAKILEKEVINFIWKNIISRIDIPRLLISDNGAQLQACPRMGKTIQSDQSQEDGMDKLQELEGKDLPRPWNVHN